MWTSFGAACFCDDTSVRWAVYAIRKWQDNSCDCSERWALTSGVFKGHGAMPPCQNQKFLNVMYLDRIRRLPFPRNHCFAPSFSANHRYATGANPGVFGLTGFKLRRPFIRRRRHYHVCRQISGHVRRYRLWHRRSIQTSVIYNRVAWFVVCPVSGRDICRRG